MSKTLLIIVSGPSGSGKTRLGKTIANKFRLPFISKDDIKESLFDSLGWSDRDWSRKLGVASYGILYHITESLLSGHTSFVLESIFNPTHDTERFLNLRKKYEFDTIQVCCYADGEVRFKRFKERNESGERHPGHVDHVNYATFHLTQSGDGPERLNIPGKVFDIDTADFTKIDYEPLFEAIKSATNFAA